MMFKPALSFGRKTIIATVILTSLWISSAHANKRNLILMISDGFGPASQTYARTYKQFVENLAFDDLTVLDEILVGTARTRSSDSFITDSAAAATAFSCTIKTYNGAIAVDTDKVPCGTVLESAKHLGYLTGLVVTSTVTDATPAAFSAHVVDRDLESEIAAQQIGDYTLGRQVDLLFGGGRCFFLPNNTEGGCRTDDRDITKESQKKGFKYFSTRKEFDDLKVGKDKLPLLGLFTPEDMSYEIDRKSEEEPSLKEMSEKALDFLTAETEHSDKGFFLMIEGSKIDKCAHTNDAAAHVHEILAYYDAVAVVKKYVDDHPGTVLVSVSDHETGGLALGRIVNGESEYIWFPEVIQRVKKSSSFLSKELVDYKKDDRKEFIKDLIKNDLGIDDFVDSDIDFLNEEREADEYEVFLANMTSARAHIGWTTLGHTAVDVNLYAYGEDSHILIGNHENTEVGDFIVKYLDLDLEFITRKLKGLFRRFAL